MVATEEAHTQRSVLKLEIKSRHTFKAFIQDTTNLIGAQNLLPFAVGCLFV